MKTKDFDYALSPQLIAQHPLKSRDASRLMVVHKKSGLIEHSHFKELPHYLNSTDCLVVNNTRVFPARLKGYKAKTKGKVEVLLLKKIGKDQWQALVKPGRRLPLGTRIIFSEGVLEGRITQEFPGGEREITFEYEGDFSDFRRLLERLGEIPLPPYIKASLKDNQRYQTIYASKNYISKEGSVAAPTAGLHFTKEILETLKKKGLKIASLTLSIGLDTFRPLSEAEVESHRIHSEYFRINEKSAKVINQTLEESGRIISVGTSTARALETATKINSHKKREIEPGEGWTNLFIYPGYVFKIVDVLITNFHLPRSTLLLMISAFAGKELIRKAYREAIKGKYRFLSFGDCMLLQD